MVQDLFTLYINCYTSQEVICGGTVYRQILFDGEAKGSVFQGKILPGGVDTQIIAPDGSGTLSARYMLEGVDRCGNSCRIYVDNHCSLGDEITSPRCYSDSPELQWLQNAALKGRMINDEDGFKIVIFQEK